MSADMAGEPSILTPLEWLMPWTYITQILFFPSTDPEVLPVLQQGLSDVVDDVPYLLSGIVRRTKPNGTVGMSEQYQSITQLLLFRDLSAQIDYSSLKRANFAPSSLQALDIPTGLEQCSNEPSPIFRAVACKVKDGFLLSVSLHHSTTDITGVGALLKTWAARCKTKSSDSVDTCKVSFDRGILAASTSPLTDVPNLPPKLLRIVDGTTNLRPATKQDVPLATEIFSLQKVTLQRLKEKVTRHLTLLGLSWVSTGDIVTALLWAAIDSSDASVRSLPNAVVRPEDRDPVLDEGTSIRSVGFPVDFRKRCDPPLSEGCLGAAFLMTSAIAQEADLFNVATKNDEPSFIASLARVAAAVRHGIGLVNQENITSVLSYLASQQDMTKIKLGPQSSQFSLVSWADEGVCGLDWGKVVDRCEAVRPPVPKTKRHPIVLPRLPNGDLEVFAHLETTTIERLKGMWFLNQKAPAW